MNDQPKSRWYWRWLRRGLITLAVLATLVAVAITEENWRGKRDWEDYRAQAAARGDLFENTTTNNIPDEQNFAKAPIFSGIATMRWNGKEGNWEPSSNTVDRAKMSIARWDGSWPEHANGDWSRGRPTDLKAWQTYYRTAPTNSAASSNSEGRVARVPISIISTNSPAADVLLALSPYEAAIEELRADSQRPLSRFGNYDWADPKTMALNLVYLSDMKGFCSVLALRASAELASDQSARALADVQLMLRLNDKLRQEPVMISHLVCLATMVLTLQPVYDGLARHAWSDAQLAELEPALAAKDFLADYQTAMRGERAFTISALDEMRLNRRIKLNDDSFGTETVNYNLTPSAVFYQNELTLARIHEQLFQPQVDLEKHIASPSVQRHASAVLAQKAGHYRPYELLAIMDAEAMQKAVEHFAEVQSQTDFARIACALERYRLAQGNYPETLDVLAPQFIDAVPHDVINGEPLHYRRTEDGNFLLYSVGWNETDDHGTVVVVDKPGRIDREKGDWVWRYPGK